MQKKVDDFRLKLGDKEYVPIMIGGMGVDISTSDLALEASRLGGIGHISDAMSPTINDRKFGTKFVQKKLKNYKHNLKSSDKSSVKFNLEELAEAQKNFVTKTMQEKQISLYTSSLKGDRQSRGIFFRDCNRNLLEMLY